MRRVVMVFRRRKKRSWPQELVASAPCSSLSLFDSDKSGSTLSTQRPSRWYSLCHGVLPSILPSLPPSLPSLSSSPLRFLLHTYTGFANCIDPTKTAIVSPQHPITSTGSTGQCPVEMSWCQLSSLSPQACLTLPQSVGVIGGRPRHALYLIGYHGRYCPHSKLSGLEHLVLWVPY